LATMPQATATAVITVAETSQEMTPARSATVALPPDPGGFTLLEVVIAVIIAGIAIVALLRAGANALNATHTASRVQDAVTRAQSHLDAVLYGAVLVPGDSQGDDGDGFHWRVRVTPTAATTIGPHGAARRSGPAVTLYAVSVWIGWRDGGARRDVRLDTEQIGQ
jgi:general secretion pathway protein I